MRKKKLLLWVFLAISAVAAGVTTVALMVKHQPAFYQRSAIAAGKDRQDLSRACMGRFADLVGHVMADDKQEWEVTFSEAQINSYFLEDFVTWTDAQALKQQNINDLRLEIQNNKLRLGFRFGEDPISSVVSYDVRVWLAPKEINVIAVEILGHHAGALPIGTEALLNEITTLAQRRGIDISWYRHQGNPVALIRIQSDRPRATAQLRRIELRQGMIVIGGISFDPTQQAAARPSPLMLEPLGN